MSNHGWGRITGGLAGAATLAVLAATAGTAQAAQILTNTDGVIRSSLCTGFDCPDNPNFGAASDTQILNEDRLRIFFDDASDPGSSFPDNDWRFLFNDINSGGREMFAVEDSTAGRIPFLLEAGAGNDSIHIDSSGNLGGNVGFGTANPVVDLHTASGNTPTLRLEQNGSSGFSPETWDIAGNETNFFIRDVTNGSKLPFRIRPGAPTSAIDIAANGNLGFGDSSPDAAVNVERPDGTAKILVEETGGSGDQTLLDLTGNTSSLARYFVPGTPTADPPIPDTEWFAGAAQGGEFVIASGPTLADPLTVKKGGEVAADGAIDQSADPATQSGIAPLTAADTDQIMAQLRTLTLRKYRYASDPAAERHLAPTGDAFATAFGLGAGPDLSAADMAGVALAASQQLDRRLSAVEAGGGGGGGNAELESRVLALERKLTAADRKVKKATKKAKKALKAVKKLSKR